MTDAGVEVSTVHLRSCEASLVKSAFNSHHRQLNNWWPDTLFKRYDELFHQGGGDHTRRLCL
eukprot:8745676-Pyramimonas_sp.AAC.1